MFSFTSLKNNSSFCSSSTSLELPGIKTSTKLFKEKILNGEAKYTENKLLEINFQNAKCTYDTNKNLYVNKKKSNGKVDMVVAIINAVYLLEQDVFLNQMDFTIQIL